MYSIYVDDTCIYSDISPSNKNKVLDPVLTLEDNAAGSLEFTIPTINAGYEVLKRMTSEVVVKREGTEIWSGRILSEDHDFYNNKKIYCEGELAYFNDSIQPPAEYHDITPRALLETFVNIHNSQVTEKYRFTVGAVTVTDPNDSLYRYTNYEKTLQCLSDKFLSRLGGHFMVRKQNGVRYLDYLADYPKTATQQINFGKNILDFAKNYNMDDFCTIIVPRGTQISATEYADNREYKVGEYCIHEGYIYRCKVAIGEDGEAWTDSHWTRVQKYYEALTPYLTVEEVNNGSIYVGNTDLINQYGRIVNVYDWSDVTEPSILLSKAREKLTSINYDKITIEITAVDLRLMNVKYEAFDILDNVRVISKPHGVDRLFPIRKMQIPMSTPERTTFTMTHNTEIDGSLTGSTVKGIQSVTKSVDALSDSVSAMPSQVLESAKANANSLINMATNGYVTIVKNKNGTSELIISDEKDYTKAHKVWRWNVNGLGYSNNGYNGPYGLAMTMDGSIVADYITTGTMSADRMKGGTLEVGGSGFAKDGSIIVKDASNNTLASLNKTGLDIKKGSITGTAINLGGANNEKGLLYIRNATNEIVASLTGDGLALFDDNQNLLVNLSKTEGLNSYKGTIRGTTIYHYVINSIDGTFYVGTNGDITTKGEIYSEHGTSSFQYCVGRSGLYTNGEKPRVIDTEHFGLRNFIAYETATPYFGDIGEAVTDDEGICKIFLDEILLESVDSFCNYQVFLQAYDKTEFYVTERNQLYFTVESNKPNAKFSWEVKMPQRDMSGVRFSQPPYEVMDIMKKGKNYD